MDSTNDMLALRPLKTSSANVSVTSVSPIPLTVGAEPNPSAPHTPDDVSEATQELEKHFDSSLFSVEILAVLAPFSILGLLARLGILAIDTYPEQGVFSLAWVQAVGCFVMGVTQSQKDFFVSWYRPLYLGITTGFCGSLTTFAGWHKDVFLAWIGFEPGIRTSWHRFLEGFTRLVLTQAISVASFQFGVSFGSHVALNPSKPPISRLRHVFTVAATVSYIATIPVYFVLSPSYRRLATAALLFSLPGTLTRHTLGVLLNARLVSFPLGTFTSNMLGTVVIGVIQVLQYRLSVPCNGTTWAILQGIADGYAGCLSTVSTYAAEVSLLHPRHALIYVAASWLIAQLILIVIIGSAHWSGIITSDLRC